MTGGGDGATNANSLPMCAERADKQKLCICVIRDHPRQNLFSFLRPDLDQINAKSANVKAKVKIAAVISFIFYCTLLGR